MFDQCPEHKNETRAHGEPGESTSLTQVPYLSPWNFDFKAFGAHPGPYGEEPGLASLAT